MAQLNDAILCSAEVSDSPRVDQTEEASGLPVEGPEDECALVRGLQAEAAAEASLDRLEVLQSFVLSPREKARLKEVAANSGVTMSQVCREALFPFLREEAEAEGKEACSAKLSVSLTPNERDNLEFLAKLNGMTMSSFFRSLLVGSSAYRMIADVGAFRKLAKLISSRPNNSESL